MSEPMKISVITVCRDAAATIEDAINSVAGQGYRSREHIIIDGASRDGTRAIVERNRNTIDRFVSEPDNGIYDAMNKGIACASGDVIGFLNADDYYAHTEVLSHIAAQFERPEVEACYADLVYVDQRDPRRVTRYWKSRVYVDGLFETGWMPAHPTFYARREVYARCGGYDTNYRLQSDFEFTMRALAVHHVRAAYVPEIWVRMRTGGATNRSLRNVARGNLEAYRAARKNGLAVSPLFMLRKVLSRVPQFFLRPS
jgi:glycosyltransferase involved in cell wall biosynthesis